MASVPRNNSGMLALPEKLKLLFAEQADGRLTYAALSTKVLGEAGALKYDWVRPPRGCLQQCFGSCGEAPPPPRVQPHERPHIRRARGFVAPRPTHRPLPATDAPTPRSPLTCARAGRVRPVPDARARRAGREGARSGGARLPCARPPARPASAPQTHFTAAAAAAARHHTHRLPSRGATRSLSISSGRRSAPPARSNGWTRSARRARSARTLHARDAAVLHARASSQGRRRRRPQQTARGRDGARGAGGSVPALAQAAAAA